jgi:hypothetical protein
VVCASSFAMSRKDCRKIWTRVAARQCWGAYMRAQQSTRRVATSYGFLAGWRGWTGLACTSTWKEESLSVCLAKACQSVWRAALVAERSGGPSPDDTPGALSRRLPSACTARRVVEAVCPGAARFGAGWASVSRWIWISASPAAPPPYTPWVAAAGSRTIRSIYGSCRTCRKTALCPGSET